MTSQLTRLQANGIDVCYETHGPAQGTPLVMAHGFASYTDWWREAAIPLAAGRRLLLFDVRGHGRTEVPSEPSDYSMPVFAADLAALLRGLGIEKAHIGGISMGGMIAAQFAVDFPQMVESLLLCDTSAGNGQGEDPARQWESRLAGGAAMLAHIAREYGLEETLRREHEYGRQNDPRWSMKPESPEMDYERIKRMTVPGYVGAALAISQRPDLAPRLGEITAPTLIAIGEWDDFLPCALRDHERISGSRLVIRKECGHGPFWRPHTLRAAIADFLADVEAGRAVAGRCEV